MTKRSKALIYVACATLPILLFLAVAWWVYDGPCPDAGEIRSETTPSGERMDFCAARGIKHGPFSLSNSQGRRIAEGVHREGAVHGSYRRYRDGLLVEVKCYSNGSVVWTTRDMEELNTRKCNVNEATK